MAVHDLHGADPVTGPDAPATVPATEPAGPRGALGTVRRLIVFTILFVLVAITASGIAGLLARLLETRPEFGQDAAGLAQSLAFTLIGGPLAALLWWFAWRRLDGPDRASVAWGLYLSGVSFVALVTFTTSLLGMLSDLVAGRWSPGALATGVAWLAVWIVHRLMAANARRSPLRLASVPVVLGAAFGLIVAVTGAVGALAALFDAAVLPFELHIGAPWWRPVVQSLVWAAGGALVWWWHWVHERARRLSGGFADVTLVLTGVLGAAALALAGLGFVVFVALRAIADREDPWAEVLDPLGLGVAAAGVGAIVWLSHRAFVSERRPATRRAARLVEAGVGLVGAASGVGVVVNAILGSLSSPLAGGDARTVLLAGVASLVVGAPVWWWAWRPGRAATDAGAPGRRIYLVVVFGVSAVVAIIALLVVGYRIFEFALDGTGDLVDRIRAPFGLLLATALVAAYHFVVWRRDREAAPTGVRAFDRVVLVAGGDPGASVQAVREATGAVVTTWARADDAAAPDPQTVVAALREFEAGSAANGRVTARRVLVLAADDRRIEVVPLRD